MDLNILRNLSSNKPISRKSIKLKNVFILKNSDLLKATSTTLFNHLSKTQQFERAKEILNKKRLFDFFEFLLMNDFENDDIENFKLSIIKYGGKVLNSFKSFRFIGLITRVIITKDNPTAETITKIKDLINDCNKSHKVQIHFVKISWLKNSLAQKKLCNLNEYVPERIEPSIQPEIVNMEPDFNLEDDLQNINKLFGNFDQLELKLAPETETKLFFQKFPFCFNIENKNPIQKPSEELIDDTSVETIRETNLDYNNNIIETSSDKTDEISSANIGDLYPRLAQVRLEFEKETESQKNKSFYLD